MTTAVKKDFEPNYGNFHPDFEALVHDVLDGLGIEALGRLRQDFHTRLRITLSQPENDALIEDLWDFFYDWSLFEQKVPDTIQLVEKDRNLWEHIKQDTERGLFLVQKVGPKGVRLKEMVTAKTYNLPRAGSPNMWGLSKGDLIEARLIASAEKKEEFDFVRRPSFHPNVVHGYLKQKVKQFKKSKDMSSYSLWLWLIVGMYLKHQIYKKIAIEKIYDDNSRI